MRSGRAGAAALLAMAVLLGAGAWLVSPRGAAVVLAVDVLGLGAVNSLRATGVDRAFIGITWLGSLYVLMPVALLVAWRSSAASWLERGYVPLALIGASAIAHLAKQIADRPRPDLFPSLIAMPTDASFPSAHAMQVTAVAAAWLLRPGASVRAQWMVLATLAVFLVALSRVYLQVHHPSDVAIGVVASLLWVFALRAGIDTWVSGRRL